MTSTSYIVSLTSTNQWAVTMSGMATTQSASNLSSDWNGTYRIVQLSGDQTYDAIKASHYTISTEILYGKSMYEMYTSSDKNERCINASTSVPFYYNPECSTRNPVAQGKLTIYLASDVAGQYPIDIELLGENNPKLCNPKTKVTIGEYSDEYGGATDSPLLIQLHPSARTDRIRALSLSHRRQVKENRYPAGPPSAAIFETREDDF